MPIQTCWELAQQWYTGRSAHDWQRRGPEETRLLFDSLGLAGDFWRIG